MKIYVVLFIGALFFVISQRFFELKIAKRNTRRLLNGGAAEFGRNHYWVLILLHTLFFASLIGEAFIRGVSIASAWPLYLAVFLFAQFVRIWVIRTMNGRWTTRVIVIPGEQRIHRGPFRFFHHPNYIVVAIEIFTLPMLFNFYITAIIFTILNATVLFAVRLPVETRALRFFSSDSIRN